MLRLVRRSALKSAVKGSNDLTKKTECAAAKAWLVCVLTLFLVAGCRPSGAGKTRLQGAGATFPRAVL